MDSYTIGIVSLLPKVISSKRESILADPFYEIAFADDLIGCS